MTARGVTFNLSLYRQTRLYLDEITLGRVFLSINNKLLFGEKSPVNSLGICKGETDTIAFGRNYFWSSCLKQHLRGGWMTFN